MKTASQWTPSNGTDIQPLRAGQWWDAVRVRTAVGNRALELLGEASGAVIADPDRTRLYFLIPPGTAEGWNLRYADVLGNGPQAVFVGVPAISRTEGPGVYWLVPPQYGQYLTDPVFLYKALGAATLAELRVQSGDGR
ncbi:hypothetical protein ABZS86_14605 [Streptomyces sp. NPDC005355]|uniref:hypothetical protein n=1 Tax=Streptomyces sp. NPDC005355 TaxID=3157038 RepID=UPI0033B9D0EB